jgi:predicted nucleotidyltransferase
MIEQPPIEQITRKIVEAFHPARIVLFGSRARGDARPDSDVDLMVEMETDMRPIERMRSIYQLFHPRRWSMDVVVWTPQEVTEQRQYRNSLMRKIEQEGRVLYEQGDRKGVISHFHPILHCPS